MCLVMEELGVSIERQHHEVATAGQAEIDYRFDTLVKSADAMMVYKYVVKNVAKHMARRPVSCPNRCLAITARACTPINRSGRKANPSLPAKNMPGFRTWRFTTLAACSSTLAPVRHL